jgi:hypothetical protein
MTLAPGKVLRAAARDHLLLHHLRRFKRQVITLGFLAMGAVAIVAVVLGTPSVVLGVWIGIGGVAFTVLWYRRRGLRSAVYIATEWVLGAIGLALGALRPVPPAERFVPHVERLHPINDAVERDWRR